MNNDCYDSIVHTKSLFYLNTFLKRFLLVIVVITNCQIITGQDLEGHLAIEMNYDRSFEMNSTVVVHLTKYLDCTAEFLKDTEIVHVHGVADVQYLGSAKLELVHEREIKMDSFPSCLDSFSEMNNCIKVVKYSGEVSLSGSPGGFDITWGNCCLPTTSLMNISTDTDPSYALVLRVDWMGENNKAAQLQSIPSFIICSEKDTPVDFNFLDADEDEIRISSSKIYTTQSEQAIHVNYFMDPVQSSWARRTQATASVDDNTNIRTGRPPLISISPNIQPDTTSMMGILSCNIDNERSSIQLNATIAGTYIQALEIQEIRNEQIISNHPILIFWRGM